jgi:hypothetical protein
LAIVKEAEAAKAFFIITEKKKVRAFETQKTQQQKSEKPAFLIQLNSFSFIKNFSSRFGA